MAEAESLNCMRKVMATQKFIVVSNRLPVSVSKQDGKLVFTPSPGGLATAMSSLDMDPTQRLWIGWPGISSDGLSAAEKREIIKKLQEYGCYPVFLTEQQVRLFYEGYSNDTIWPLFHYFMSLAKYADEYWVAYQEANQVFADTVVKLATADATIWVHDYHLMLLPQLLREQIECSAIGFFLHIPFPSFEIFRLLPQRKEIIQGLLGADLVGFHIYDYVRHFISSVVRTWGYEVNNGRITLEDRIVQADAFPIGIDYKKFKDTLASPTTQKEIKLLTKHYKDQKIILSVDRLDYSKGIAQRLEAFELFLKQNPSWHKKVKLVVVAVPSRIEVNAYKNLRDTIEQTVSRINGTYATVDWTPISYQFQNLPFDQLVAVYAKADIAMVTPLRDGMNLVAKEYVAAKQDLPGVLILSELTGAVDELPEALVINPNDTQSIVRAIQHALLMPEVEQKARIQAMQRRIKSYSVKRWANDFIENLAAIKESQQRQNSKILSGKQKDKIIADFQAAKNRLLLLDYDGTVREFVSSPQAVHASPPEALLDLVRTLAKKSRTDVCIISGRSRDALETWFGKLPVLLVAEHGAWVKLDGEWAQADTDFQSYKNRILPVLERFTDRTPGAMTEEKSSSLVWHYRNVSPELAYARRTTLRHELSLLLKGTDLGIYNGHKIIEIKPQNISKGLAVNELLVRKRYDFIFCCGDDYTDEDMFRMLPDNSIGVKVGLGDTSAQYQVSSIQKMLAFLQRMAG